MKRSINPFMALAFALALTGAALTGATVAGAADRALIVAIGEYQADNAQSIPGTERDIEMMVDVLSTLGFGGEQIMILRDSQATLDGIRQGLGWLARETGPGDRAFYYHSGHGVTIRDVSGDESDGYDEALVPYDTRFDRHGIPSDGLLVDDELGAALTALRASETIVMIDSCYSGTMTRSAFSSGKSVPTPGPPRKLNGTFFTSKAIRRTDGAVVLLSATSAGEEAQATPQGALFTQAIWNDVMRHATSRHLTLEELRAGAAAFIRETLVQAQRKTKIHHPQLEGPSALRQINLFLPAPGNRPPRTNVSALPPDPYEENVTPAADTPSDNSTNDGPDLWASLEILTRDADDVLAMQPNKTAFRLREPLAVTVTAERNGYLYLLNLGDGEDEISVLFPNRYQRDNEVRTGDVVRIPEASSDQFRLLARLPAERSHQQNLLVAIVTEVPLPVDDVVSSTDVFRVLRREEATRSIQRLSYPGRYSAAQVVVKIQE